MKTKEQILFSYKHGFIDGANEEEFPDQAIDQDYLRGYEDGKRALKEAVAKEEESFQETDKFNYWRLKIWDQ